MKDWLLYGNIGFEHILTMQALDHILFLVALTASVRMNAFKPLLLLITAFTMGHTTTLLLSSSRLIDMPSSWIEFLIPMTIVVTAGTNLATMNSRQNGHLLRYLTVLFFGFIHGMGFAKDLTMMLAKSDRVFYPLLYMNVGLEIAQVLVVAAIVLLAFAAQQMLGVTDSQRSRFASLIALGGGLFFTILHLPF